MMCFMSAIFKKFIRTSLCLVLLGILFSLGEGESLAQSGSPANWQVDLVGQLGGFSKCVAVRGNYVYLGVGPRLVILDISDPSKPAFVGQSGVMPDVIEDIAIPATGNYIYLADGGGGLRIINISNPSVPAQTGFYNASSDSIGVAISGNFVYVADGGAGLRIFNVSNPAAPIIVGAIITTGYASDVAVANNKAYLAADTGGLRIIDVTTPANPVQLGYFDTSGNAHSVAVSGNYAYIADWTDGLRIIQVSTPASPTEVGFLDTDGTAIGVAIYNKYALVADSTNGLRVIDISTPAAPSEAAFFITPGYAYNVAVSGSYAYVADETYGLRAIRYSPTPAAEVGYFDTSGVGYGISVSGSYAYVTAGYKGMQIVNITNPALPSGVTYQNTPGFATNVETAGNYAYIADGSSGLRIIDKTNPAAPSEVGFNTSPLYAFNLALSESLVYVADYNFGLSIINISNPAAPSETGYTTTPGYPRGVAVSGNYAYVTVDTDGLRVINKSNPASPSEVGYFDTAGQAYDVAVSGNYAYVADGDDGLRIINISNPSTPSEAGFYKTAGFAQGVKVYGNYAYVAGGESGLRIIDVGKPTLTSEVGFYDTPGYTNDVIISGNLAYVADGDSGLVILRLCAVPATPILTAPANSSTTRSDNTPKFDWNIASDTNEYELQVDDNPDFSSPVIDVIQTATDYTPSAYLNNATYYWRVRGHSTAGGCDCYGSYSSIWTVTVAVPPGEFGKTTPAYGALGLPTTLIPFSWQSSSWATSYQFCFDTSNDNACSTWNEVGTSTAFYWDGPFAYATTYYWQARACNTICTYANSNTWWSFMTNDQYEPDNSAAQATLVTPGATDHSIAPTGDADWIKFTLGQELAVFIQTSGSGNGDTILTLYGSDGSTMLETNDDWGGGMYAYIDRTCKIDTLPAGTYYVKVESKNGVQIPTYSLNLTTWGCKVFLPLVFKDHKLAFEGPFEQEDNDSTAQANGPIHSGQDYQGYPDDANDYFSFSTGATGDIAINLSNHIGSGVQVILYYQTTDQRVEPVCQKPDGGTSCAITYPSQPGGLYYLRIYTASGFNTTTPYTLRVTYP
jgi:hypothetical protein